jgi:hypothetical protein
MAVYAQVGVLYFGLSRPSTTKFLIWPWVRVFILQMEGVFLT